MATHDYFLSNASGAAFRADLNNALAAIVSNNSSSTPPDPTYKYMWWMDTDTGQLKQRNAANDGWITIREIDGTLLMEDGTASAPGLAFASALDSGFFRPSNGRLAIATNGSEWIRIMANGDFRIGQTSTAVPGLGNTTTGVGIETSNGAIFASRQNDASLSLNSNANSSVANFSRSGTIVGSINVTTTNTSFNTSSDYRLKENVTPVSDGIARLRQLKPSRFNFIADPNKTVDGFLAHEVQSIVPEAINGEKDAVDADGNPSYQGIDQSKIVPLVVAALQEAIGEIESLKARVDALESA